MLIETWMVPSPPPPASRGVQQVQKRRGWGWVGPHPLQAGCLDASGGEMDATAHTRLGVNPKFSMHPIAPKLTALHRLATQGESRALGCNEHMDKR